MGCRAEEGIGRRDAISEGRWMAAARHRLTEVGAGADWLDHGRAAGRSTVVVAPSAFAQQETKWKARGRAGRGAESRLRCREEGARRAASSLRSEHLVYLVDCSTELCEGLVVQLLGGGPQLLGGEEVLIRLVGARRTAGVVPGRFGQELLVLLRILLGKLELLL
ncbi:hypothetical protein T492DRAFT_1013100 [Pavlovales sp. CCMP2436]|nr:hypothetical protein T492DRAFT_1013100 [Pavlovales sp. CCMP2436]|eukprot:CAMPEP_0180011484 /NCGR_PEP_ID=MMETSP0984-20121128/16405_1 /TAXON_ID=483367 /ORGANISM="non described non described, Strain CCMP 2436" /LENGTH=164 /DNA_ID=CAMNT_0021933569 /DNA_START=368 /DNA_END=862 /DNA_ORIENTATION=-